MSNSNDTETEKRAILLQPFTHWLYHDISRTLHFGHTGTVYIRNGIHRFHPDGEQFAIRIAPAHLYDPETCQPFPGIDAVCPA